MFGKKSGEKVTHGYRQQYTASRPQEQRFSTMKFLIYTRMTRKTKDKWSNRDRICTSSQ